MSVSEECQAAEQTDSGVSAPGPGAGRQRRRRRRANLWELVRKLLLVQGGGQAGKWGGEGRGAAATAGEGRTGTEEDRRIVPAVAEGEFFFFVVWWTTNRKTCPGRVVCETSAADR